MASPRVFISSTCYDLKYIRENIKYFIKTLGYEPVLSEDGDVFYNPKIHTHDACLEEIPNCQVFVLIIGGRFGGTYKESEHSITNAEYKEAIRLRTPIFTLVDHSVFKEHHVYSENKRNKDIDATKIRYPSTDDHKIFDFIDEVRKNSFNNAVVPFRDYSDIEEYLRKQWASMMFTFLAKQNEEDRIADTLSVLGTMNERIEMLSQQILKSVGTDEAKITVKLYNKLISEEFIKDLSFCWEISVIPADILKFESVEKLLKFYNKKYNFFNEEDENSISTSGNVSKIRFNIIKRRYLEIREKLIDILHQYNLTVEKYIESQNHV